MNNIRHHKSIQFTAQAERSYKIGVDEVEGMQTALVAAFTPVRDRIRSKAYWDENLEFNSLEYKSRDGFIANSHNCGGLELTLHVPNCEQYDWGFLEFGECDGCADDGESCLGDDSKYPENGGECGYQADGHLDSYLRIILKFEGFNEAGEMEFYINVCGGNNDAPYFRVKHLPDLLEGSFTCKTLKQIGMKAKPHVKRILKLLGGE